MTYPGIENDPAALAADPDRAAVEARRKEQEAEFSAYVALQDIPWGNVPANFAGEAVAKSTVERLGWLDLGLVAKRSSKAAREVLERTNSATPQELEQWAEQDKAAAAKSSSSPKSTGGNA